MVQYQRFKVEDFATDEYFRMWVLTPNNSVVFFWEEWLKEHPEKAETVRQARQLVLAVHNEANAAAPDVINRMWNRIAEETILQSQEAHPIPLTAKRPFFTLAYRIAAAVLFLLIAGGITYKLVFHNRVVYATGFGELLTVQLPDGSNVVLNANSELRFERNWENRTVREVELKGEAFFGVREKQIRVNGKAVPVKFAVSTPDLRVEVLGTQFNVTNRRNRTDVALKSGKIRLALHTKKAEKTLLMKPGDFLSYSSQGEKLIKDNIDPDRIDTWRFKRWYLRNASLEEVALQLEETFGLPVQWGDQSLKKRRVSGIIPTNDLHSVLEALSVTLSLHIIQENDHIVVDK